MYTKPEMKLESFVTSEDAMFEFISEPFDADL